jgi:hypothetical protein
MRAAEIQRMHCRPRHYRQLVITAEPALNLASDGGAYTFDELTGEAMSLWPAYLHCSASRRLGASRRKCYPGHG